LTPIGLSEEMFSVVVLLRNTSEVSLLMSAWTVVLELLT
jgi:hypothetical protein